MLFDHQQHVPGPLAYGAARMRRAAKSRIFAQNAGGGKPARGSGGVLRTVGVAEAAAFTRHAASVGK